MKTVLRPEDRHGGALALAPGRLRDLTARQSPVAWGPSARVVLDDEPIVADDRDLRAGRRSQQLGPQSVLVDPQVRRMLRLYRARNRCFSSSRAL